MRCHVNTLVAALLSFTSLLFPVTSYSQTDLQHKFPALPDSLVGIKDRANFLVEHYWDDVDDSLFTVHRCERDEHLFADYLLFAGLADRPVTIKNFEILLEKVSDSESRSMALLDYCVKYLYNSDSPFRDDELFRDLLKCMWHSSRSRLLAASVSYYSDMADNCRPGTVAPDFEYISRDFARRRFHESAGHPVLLVFHYPGCQDCLKYIQQLHQSVAVNQAIGKGLELLFVCPDGDFERWRNEKQGHHGINSVYAGHAADITEEKYCFRGIPASYLIDAEMKIILKEPSLEDIETVLPELF